MKLKDDILNLLIEEKTVPQLERDLGIGNEFEILREIDQLEQEGKVVLTGFVRIYREDGGAIYLAKYKKV